MKITRILPQKIAKAWQEYDIRKLETKLEYYSGMAMACRTLLDEGYQELERLERKSK